MAEENFWAQTEVTSYSLLCYVLCGLNFIRLRLSISPSLMTHSDGLFHGPPDLGFLSSTSTISILLLPNSLIYWRLCVSIYLDRIYLSIHPSRGMRGMLSFKGEITSFTTLQMALALSLFWIYLKNLFGGGDSRG